MGEVLYRRAHLALTNALSDSRYSAVEGSGFLCGVNRVFWVRIYRGNPGAGSILKPFEPTVWAAITASLVLLVITAYVFLGMDTKATGAADLMIEIVVKGMLDQAFKICYSSVRARYVLVLIYVFHIRSPRGLPIQTLWVSKGWTPFLLIFISLPSPNTNYFFVRGAA